MSAERYNKRTCFLTGFFRNIECKFYLAQKRHISLARGALKCSLVGHRSIIQNEAFFIWSVAIRNPIRRNPIVHVVDVNLAQQCASAAPHIFALYIAQSALATSWRPDTAHCGTLQTSMVWLWPKLLHCKQYTLQKWKVEWKGVHVVYRQ